jgi:hypothetical protein
MTDMELFDKINKELTELSIGFSKADVAIGRLTLLVDALKKIKRCTSDNKPVTAQSIRLGIDDKLSKIEEDLEELASIGMPTASKDKEDTKPSATEKHNKESKPEYPIHDVAKFLFENSKYEIPRDKVQIRLCDDDTISFMVTVELPFELSGVISKELFFISISDNLTEMLEEFDDAISNLNLVEFAKKNRSTKSKAFDWFSL